MKSCHEISSKEIAYKALALAKFGEPVLKQIKMEMSQV